MRDRPQSVFKPSDLSTLIKRKSVSDSKYLHLDSLEHFMDFMLDLKEKIKQHEFKNW